MAISLTEDFKTVEELRSNPDALLEQAMRTRRPVVVTRKGKPQVVILEAALYEERLKTVNLARLIAEAEADIRAGRTRPADEVFAELLGEKKIPS